MNKITVIAAAVAMSLSAGAAQAGGWGKGGSLLNISPDVNLDLLNGSGILNNNPILSGILDGNDIDLGILGGHGKGKHGKGKRGHRH